MKSSHLTFFLLLSALLLSSGVSALRAQEQLTLSVQEAVNIALQKNKMLKVSEAKVLAGKARFDEVSAGKYAWLKLSAGITRLSPVDPFKISMPFGPAIEISPSIYNNYNAKLSALQPLYTGNKISAGIEAAENAMKASEADYIKDREEVTLNVKTAYWSLFKAMEFKKLLDENVGQVKAHLEDAKNMLAAGMLTNNDVLKLEVQLSDVLFRQAEANNGVALARLGLNNVLGIPLDTEIALSENTSYTRVAVGTREGLLSQSYENRPELKAAGLRVRASESGVDIANGSWYPQISLVGNYTYARPNPRIFPTKDEFHGTWDISLGLSFDIWDWNARSFQAQQAEAQVIQAREAMNMIQDGISLEVSSNYLTMKQADEKIRIAEAAKNQAEENFRITGERFKQGLALSSDLVDAEVAYLQAKTNYTTAVVDYELAAARLQKSTGAALNEGKK